ncbi:MAG: hypothetical protein ACYDH1_12490 [Anaerolineaceae bacterium]
MSETQAIPENHDESGYYEIRLKGQLNDRWAEWLGEITITLEEDGNTLLTCLVIDQAALHGLLKRVRGLSIPLLSVNFVRLGQARTQEENGKPYHF